MAKKKKSAAKPSALPFLILHGIVVFVTMRDIGKRPDAQVRGSKGVWRFVSSINTVGAVAYWIVGRKHAEVEATGDASI
jgi:hypothetical protein